MQASPDDHWEASCSCPVSRGSVSVAESWRSFYDETGVPSAVESGALVWVTGHTGTRADGSVEPDDTEQVRQTFRT